jgi:hypothetical protein
MVADVRVRTQLDEQRALPFPRTGRPVPPMATHHAAGFR